MISKIFVLALIGLSSFSAHAVSDVSCWDGDCLSHGWTAKDLNTNNFTDYACYRDGCQKDGWIAGGTENIRYYTQCKASGCFISGWYEIDRDTQMMRMQTICVSQNGESDCLKYGWTTYSASENYITNCLKQDCRKQGWISTRNSGSTVSAYCKAGGCFTEGWIWNFQK